MKHENIPGWPGYYISKRGKLYSCKTMGCIKSKDYTKWHPIKGRINRAGRHQVMLRYGLDKTLQVGISRLVAIAWVPNPKPEEYDVVMHLDNNPLNNHYKNLKWGTQKQNIQQAIREGRNKVSIKGDDCINRKLTIAQEEEIRQKYAKGNVGYGKLAKEYNVSIATIRRKLGKKLR